MDIDPSWADGIHLSLHKQPPSWQFHVIWSLLKLYRMSRKKSAHADRETLIARKRTSDQVWSNRFKPLVPIQSKSVNVHGCQAEWLADSAMALHDLARPTILYLHGGSFTGGSIGTHRSMCGHIAYVAGARALILDYRLAPEHPFPAALEDTIAAYNWLLETGVKPEHLAVVGDSTGGGLAVSLLVALRDKGIPLPATVACLSAILDLACNSITWDTKEKYEVVSDKVSARRSINMYLNGIDPHTPLASPLYADLAGLPPILLQVGSNEALITDATSFAKKAHNAGVDVTLDIWRGMVHSWQLCAQYLPEGRAAIEKVGEFVKYQLNSKITEARPEAFAQELIQIGETV